MSDNPTRRMILKSAIGTAAFALLGLPVSKVVGGDPLPAGDQNNVPLPQKRYVFASDARAGLPGFGVMPG